MSNKNEINKYKKDNEALEIVRDNKTTSKVLIQYFNGPFHYQEYINSLIAKHPKLKLPEQEKILQESSENIVEVLLDNEFCDISIKMSALVKYSESDSIKVLLAKSMNSSKEILECLYEKFKKEENVVLNLAKNPNTPEVILNKIGESKKEALQLALASNSKIPIKILEKFAKSSEESVRILVVRNPKTPSWILQEMRAEFEEMVTKHPNYKANVEALLEGIENYATKTSSSD